MKNLLIIFITLITVTAFAQESVKDTLRTDEIIVVKPYTPTISDAFKVNDNPTLEGEEIQKEDITYNFFSVPVASTFTPTKGKAQSVVREPLDKVYDNFVAAGFGNYTTPYLEAFVHTSTARNNDFGAYLKHLSSQGGVDDVLVDDNYSDSRLDLYYKQFERDYNWEIVAGAQHEIYNWYGLSNDVMFDPLFLSEIDPKQTYLNIFAGGNVHFDEGIFKNGKLDFNYFLDNYSSSEIHVLVEPEIEFPISTELINTTFKVEYLNGKFEQNYLMTNELKHSFLNLGISPSLEVLRNDLTVNIGARVYYSFDFENSSNKFYFYPNITVSYKLVDETVIAFAGVTGDLQQNSFRGFTQENSFVSPTLNIQQTDQQYNAFIGAKGKISSKVGYNFKASYQSERNKALFVQNFTLTDGTAIITNGYQAGNSFKVVYDDVETLTIFAELDINVTKEFKFGGNVEYNSYTTAIQLEAWNLPTLKGSLFGKYNTKKWYAGLDLYFIGERKDFVIPFATVGNVVNLDSYVDLNLNGGYVFTDRLTAFVKVNNLLSNNYERYTNFEVQGIQALGGIIYKFDF